MTPKGVLFLCVANSARSQMAEGLARSILGVEWPIWSAGSEPSVVNPYAIEVMREVGVDLSSHRSKSVDEIPQDEIGTVITLCAEEVCPVFAAPVRKLHWPHPDPAAANGSKDEVLASFRHVREQLRARIQEFRAEGRT